MKLKKIKIYADGADYSDFVNLNKSKEINLNITKNLVESLHNKTHFIFFSTDKV